MGKAYRQQVERLTSRIREYQAILDSVGSMDMEKASRVRTGGYRAPGSMNRHKGSGRRKRR